jgi:cysteine desulfurase family protein (TIGR01976 family)
MSQLAPLTDIAKVRSQFPALASGFIFLENAGGSQLPACVPDAIRDYMLTSYVQLGAPYSVSAKATETVARAHQFAANFVNAGATGKAIIGSSTTQLCSMLAECYTRALAPGDEIIIAETAHEANAGPWDRMESRGFVVKTWKIDPGNYECSLESLERLLTPKAKIVAFPHVSNLLGGIVDVAAITKLAHSRGAKVVVDGVAFAPHRAIDVQGWDVDFYVFSVYKVFGPHMAILYAKNEALAELTGPNHFFIPNTEIYKFEPGGPSHEACAGLLASGEYLKFVVAETGDFTHNTAKKAFETITELELPVQKRLIDYLRSKPGVQIIGPQTTGVERVPTISFLAKRPSLNIATEVCKHGIGIRSGHMYAYRMCEALEIDLSDGVVRVSATHYNTVEEIDKLIAVLDPLI